MIANDIGRTNKRRPIVVVVDLVPLDQAGKQERTYTDNISAQGVRVRSKQHWQPGEQLDVISVSEQTAMRGEVIYSQKHGQEFFVGIRLRNCPSWPIIQRLGTLS